MSLNLLVVDDSAVMRAMIIKALRMAQLPLGEVYQAADGAEGLAQMGSHWVDLCVTDINMPVMDGEQMIESMRASDETADTPVIVVSTEGSETRIERILANGVSFVRKPFTPEEIRSAIKEAVGEYGLAQPADAAGTGDGTDF
jgi:two-component system, chemotaxis family, chemotaxis protein CheY